VTATRVTLASLILAVWTAASPCRAQEPGISPAEAERLFARAVAATGTGYQKARDALSRAPEVARPLLERMERSSDWDTRMTARFILAWIDNEESFRKIEADRGTKVRTSLIFFNEWQRGWEPPVAEEAWVLPVFVEMVVKNYVVEPVDLSKIHPMRVPAYSKVRAVKDRLFAFLPAADETLLDDLTVMCSNPHLRRVLFQALDRYYTRRIFWPEHYTEAYSRVFRHLLADVTAEDVSRALTDESDEATRARMYLALHLLGDKRAPDRLLDEILAMKTKWGKVWGLSVAMNICGTSTIPKIRRIAENTDDGLIRRKVKNIVQAIEKRAKKGPTDVQLLEDVMGRGRQAAQNPPFGWPLTAGVGLAGLLLGAALAVLIFRRRTRKT